jgi:hypothetical protein
MFLHTVKSISPLACMQAWNILIVLLDAVYTALWVPVVATFDTPYGIHSASGATDFVVGVLLCIDILIRFHARIVLNSTYKAVTLSKPRAIAHFYVLHGSFLPDALAAIPLLLLPFFSQGTAPLALLLCVQPGLIFDC